MHRNALLAVALVVAGVAAFAGGLFVYSVPDQHVHDARAGIGEAVYDEETDEVNRTMLAALGEPTVIRYENFSETARELYFAAIESDSVHRTSVDVGAPEFNYTIQTVEGPDGERRTAGHRTVIVHDDASLASLPAGYEPGYIDALVTKTESAPLGSGHHLPRLAALVLGLTGVAAGVRLGLQ